jgi:hypothetical protein
MGSDSSFLIQTIHPAPYPLRHGQGRTLTSPFSLSINPCLSFSDHSDMPSYTPVRLVAVGELKMDELDDERDRSCSLGDGELWKECEGRSGGGGVGILGFLSVYMLSTLVLVRGLGDYMAE